MSNISRLAPEAMVALAPPTLRRGRCTQVDICERATLQRIVELPSTDAFTCPDCGNDLTPAIARSGARSNLVMTAQATAILLAASAALYQMWAGLHPPPPVAALPMLKPAIIARAMTQPAPPSPPAHREPIVLRVSHPAVLPDPAVDLPFPGPGAELTSPTDPDDARFLVTAHAPPPEAAPESTPESAAAPEPIAERLAAFTSGATRAPVTIHFPPTATQLDGHARRDLARLAAWLRARHVAPDHVRVAGFTDTAGRQDDNDQMARRRATAVADALTHLGIAPGQVASFGDAAPAADNATAGGRARNRRVEIYVKAP